MAYFNLCEYFTQFYPGIKASLPVAGKQRALSYSAAPANYNVQPATHFALPSNSMVTPLSDG